jgi:hypothetical protein
MTIVITPQCVVFVSSFASRGVNVTSIRTMRNYSVSWNTSPWPVTWNTSPWPAPPLCCIMFVASCTHALTLVFPRFLLVSQSCAFQDRTAQLLMPYCDICDCNVAHANWDSHEQGRRHQENLEDADGPGVYRVSCGKCGNTFTSRLGGFDGYAPCYECGNRRARPTERLPRDTINSSRTGNTHNCNLCHGNGNCPSRFTNRRHRYLL